MRYAEGRKLCTWLLLRHGTMACAKDGPGTLFARSCARTPGQGGAESVGGGFPSGPSLTDVGEGSVGGYPRRGPAGTIIGLLSAFSSAV